MKYRFFIILCFVCLLAWITLPNSVLAQDTVTPIAEISPDALPDSVETAIETETARQDSNLNNGSDILCLPAAYQIDPENCNPLGASAYITDLAEEGIEYPAMPFTGKKLDPSYSDIPYKYARINVESSIPIGLYNSATDAAAGGASVETIPSGALRYVSYSDRMDIDEGHYVKNNRGYWLRASPAVVSTNTLGRTFTSTPSMNFGWIVDGCNPYLEPNYYSGVSSTWVNREDVFQIYDEIVEEKTTWYKIGDNQWLDRIHFRAAHVGSKPPETIPDGRWIEIDLYEQILMVYDNYELVYAALIASGMAPFYTQPGVFQIYEKKESENMTGAFETDKSDYYYLEDVPFTMYFDKLRAFHGAYWRAWYGYEQSHGCINMSNGDAHWLYNWANEGDWVWSHDPSGKTPTDPQAYSDGGA